MQAPYTSCFEIPLSNCALLCLLFDALEGCLLLYNTGIQPSQHLAWHLHSVSKRATINTKDEPYSVQYVLRAMKTSQETAESLDHLAERARVGLAWVKLENLKYETPLGRPSIPLQSRKIGALLDKFRGPGCFPNVQRNRIQAKISPSVLAQALRLSGVKIEDLQNTESLQKLEFPEGVVLTHTHGQHRLEAARLHTYPHNVWWAVDLLNEGMYADSNMIMPS